MFPLRLVTQKENADLAVQYEDCSWIHLQFQIVFGTTFDILNIPTVNGVLDLNAMPGCKNPGENRNHKKLCCLCCASGPISAIIHTNRTGYVPGK